MEMQTKLLSGRLESDLEILKKSLSPSEDLYIKRLCVGRVACALCTFEGLSDLEKLWVMAGQSMSRLPRRFRGGTELFRYLLTATAIPFDKKTVQTFEDVLRLLTAGASVLLADGSTEALAVSSQGQASRAVSEPADEGNLRGSREGFVELLRVNLSLVRRLIRGDGLRIEIFTVGSATHTEVALLYHARRCPQKLLKTLRDRLQNTGLDFAFDPGYLTPFLLRSPFCVFTPAGYTVRPDTAAAKLCEGKVILLVNGSPFALILPYFFCENFQSMDDYIQRPYFSTFIRLLRYAAFLISILLPGIFAALANFTPELFTARLLAQVATAEQGTPLPLFWELLCVNLLLETVREAGLRMPKAIGSSVSLVSALIIGDAAIRVGLLGMPVIVVCALAALCSYAVPSLYEAGIILRLMFILVGGAAGPVALALTGYACFLSVCRPNPFGLPYTAPLTPYTSALWKDGILRASWRQLTQKPPFVVWKQKSVQPKNAVDQAGKHNKRKPFGR